MLNHTWTFDVIGGRPLPNCPFPSSSIPPIQGDEDPEGNRPAYHNPTTATTFFLLSLIFFIFSLLTVFKYSQVKIFNRVIKHPSVTNYYSIAFFAVLSLACILDGIRYALDFSHKSIQNDQIFFERKRLDGFIPAPMLVQDSPLDREERYIVGPDVIDSWLLLASMISRSFSLFLLTLFLNQQKNHRSASVPEAPLSGISVLVSRVSDEESAPLLINSPTFDATPISEISDADVTETRNELDLNNTIDDEEEENIPSTSLMLILKWKIMIQRLNEVYFSLEKTGWLVPLVSLFSFIIRICIVTYFVDSARLSDYYPGMIQTMDSLNSNRVYIVSIIGSFVQIMPILFIVAPIVFNSSINDRRSVESTLFSRILLLVSLAATFVFWIEPSVLCRIGIDLFGTTRNESLCVVPPWWWQKVKGFPLTHIPAHGWASYFDLALWISGMGIFGLFSFMKLEYSRNAEQWIAATVSEVQSTFGFY